MPLQEIRPGITVEINGERVRVTGRFPEEPDVWVVVNLATQLEQFFTQTQLLGANGINGTETPPTPPVPDAEAVGKCHFCNTNYRYRKVRKVCATCRHIGRGQCWFCGEFKNRIFDHYRDECQVAKKFSCLRCGKVHFPRIFPLNWQNIKGTLCSRCVQNGYGMCRNCNVVYERVRGDKYLYCVECHPLPRDSVWRKIAMPIGGPPIIQTKSWRTFGVEIETFRIPNKAKIEPDIAKALPKWTHGGDGSIVPPRTADQTLEFKSPPYFGDNGLYQLRKDVLKIRDMGYRCNRSTGLHVHVDAQDLSEADHLAVKKFCRWFEDDVFSYVAPSRRHNDYCSTLKSDNGRGSRYYWLNLEAYRKYRTLEIRLHHGTTRSRRVKEWVIFCLALIEAGIRYGRRNEKPSGDLLTLLGFDWDRKRYWTSVKQRMEQLSSVYGAS